MKAKKFENKLTLNKKTIADLNKDEMNSVYGADESWEFLCTRAADCETIPKPRCTNQGC